ESSEVDRRRALACEHGEQVETVQPRPGRAPEEGPRGELDRSWVGGREGHHHAEGGHPLKRCSERRSADGLDDAVELAAARLERRDDLLCTELAQATRPRGTR